MIFSSTISENTLTLVHQRNTVVVGVPPHLGSDPTVASPDLHLDAVSGICVQNM